MDRNKMSPVSAGITGLILGIVGTTAIAMSDKQTRTKVTKKANEMKDQLEKWSKDTFHDLKETGDEAKRQSVEKTEELRRKAASSEEELPEENKKVL